VCACVVLIASASGLGASLARATHTGNTGIAPIARIASERINPNRADASRLTLLPGIGPVLAERIVAERLAGGPYADPGDLARVRGIGPKTVERISGHLVFASNELRATDDPAHGPTDD